MKAPEPHPVADRDAYSIAEFAKRHSLSRSYVYELLARGEGPAVLAIGRRRLITREAAADWRRRNTAGGAA